jgi:hypothetical protein
LLVVLLCLLAPLFAWSNQLDGLQVLSSDNRLNVGNAKVLVSQLGAAVRQDFLILA